MKKVAGGDAAPAAQTVGDGGRKTTVKKPTITRISEGDKRALEESQLGLWAGLPKSVKPARHQVMIELGEKCREMVGHMGLQKSIASGFSFHILVFDTTEHRNSALTRLATSPGFTSASGA